MKFSLTSFWGLDVLVRRPLSLKIRKAGEGGEWTDMGITEPLYSDYYIELADLQPSDTYYMFY